MLTTLWIMSVAATLTMAAVLAGRNAVDSGSHRVELLRGRWIAVGCLRRTQATIDAALSSAPSDADADAVWRTLGRAISAPVAGDTSCAVELEAAGTKLNVNDASEEMIASLLIAAGSPSAATERADAIVDWTDSDDVPSPFGVERDWYQAAHRFLPRNGPLADIQELRRIRGFESPDAAESLLGVEPGRVSLATAPVPVLMAVPGFTRETAERVVELQDAGTPIRDLLAVTGAISEESAAALAARFPEASRLTTADPDAWLVRSRVIRGRQGSTVTIEWRIVRIGRHCVIVSTRSNL